MLKKKKAVIFDLDGTLVDSMWVWPEIDRVYLKKYQLTAPENFQKGMEGLSYTETAQYFIDTFPKLKRTREEIKQEWTEMATEFYARKVQLKPGAGEFLKHLQDSGIVSGIATSNGIELVQTVLEALQIKDFFASIRTSCEVGVGKPAPDVYLKVAADLQMDPTSCLVFEDVPNGILAGKNAGMSVCAVDDAFSKEDEPKKRQLADYFIRDYHDIKNCTYEVCRVI